MERPENMTFFDELLTPLRTSSLKCAYQPPPASLTVTKLFKKLYFTILIYLQQRKKNEMKFFEFCQNNVEKLKFLQKFYQNNIQFQTPKTSSVQLIARGVQWNSVAPQVVTQEGIIVWCMVGIHWTELLTIGRSIFQNYEDDMCGKNILATLTQVLLNSSYFISYSLLRKIQNKLC